jgi:sarcosine oxidase, subunit beta
MARSADVLVVGAGIVGSSIALELARAGRKVLVVDKGPGPGTGSTSASSAVVRFHYSTLDGVSTAWEAKFGWEAWADHLGHVDPAGLARYHRTGALVFDYPGFRSQRVVELYDKIGIPFEVLSAAEIRSRFPYLRTGRHYPPKALADDAFWADADGEIGGFYTPEGGFVDDPALAAHNLMHAAMAEGAEALFRQEVAAVTRDAGRVTGLELASGERLSAPVVVNAAGPHSAVVNELAGVLGDFRVSTRPLRQEVHHVPGPSTYTVEQEGPVCSDGDLGTYFRPQAGGGVLVGGMEPECDPFLWLDDPDVYNANPTTAVWEAQATRLARRIDVTVPPRPKGIVGVYDVSDDWIPIYDRTSLDGYYVAIGTSGNQFKNAPVIGRLLRAVIEGVESGRDHDSDPVRWTGPNSGLEISLGHYSRRRERNPDSSNSVLG